MVKSNGEKDKETAGSCDLQPLVSLLQLMKNCGIGMPATRNIFMFRVAGISEGKQL